MTERKHTPGPWIVRHVTRKGYADSVWIGYWQEYEPFFHLKEGWYDPKKIREVADALPKKKRKKFSRVPMSVENARLIAAAPDLLEALILMVDQFTKTPSTLKDSEARLKAHAAIAKATGEAPERVIAAPYPAKIDRDSPNSFESNNDKPVIRKNTA